MARKVSVFLEERFSVDSEGRYSSAVFDKSFWDRYLDVFERVRIVARADLVGEHIKLDASLNSDKISFHRLPSFKGGVGLFVSLLSLLSSINRAIDDEDVCILRMPGAISIVAGLLLFVRRRKFSIELVGDPFEVFMTSNRNIFSRYFLSYTFLFFTKFFCARSSALSYVSGAALADRYPARTDAFLSCYSSIDLPESLVVDGRDIAEKSDGGYVVLAVGSMEQLYKGFDTLILAFRIVIDHYPNSRLLLVGDGSYRKYLESIAKEANLAHAVRFEGKVSRNEVFRFMDDADVLVAPSRTEGLPRVIIEALARGLPCIGSRVGGIPDLLPEKVLVKPDNPNELALRIKELLGSPDLRRELSSLGILKSREYTTSVLQVKRRHFYSQAARA